jgi:hypothetical protein
MIPSGVVVPFNHDYGVGGLHDTHMTLSPRTDRLERLIKRIEELRTEYLQTLKASSYDINNC